MPQGLAGQKIAVLAADGVEERELTEPWQALEGAGAVVVLVSIGKEVTATGGSATAPKTTHAAGCIARDAKAADFAGLVIPVGSGAAGLLRADAGAVDFVRGFVESDKPVATICHGALLLVEADALRGRTITSWPSLQTDIRNAGAEWVDKPVQVDQSLVTSRRPEDLPAFCARMVKVFEDAIAERSADDLSAMSFPASDPPPGPASIGAASKHEDARPDVR